MEEKRHKNQCYVLCKWQLLQQVGWIFLKMNDIIKIIRGYMSSMKQEQAPWNNMESRCQNVQSLKWENETADLNNIIGGLNILLSTSKK